jgi:hypothetical protein
MTGPRHENPSLINGSTLPRRKISRKISLQPTSKTATIQHRQNHPTCAHNRTASQKVLLPPTGGLLHRSSTVTNVLLRQTLMAASFCPSDVPVRTSFCRFIGCAAFFKSAPATIREDFQRCAHKRRGAAFFCALTSGFGTKRAIGNEWLCAMQRSTKRTTMASSRRRLGC